MIAGWVLIAAGALCAFAALVLFVDARRHDPRPPFAGPNQYTRAPQEAAGPLAPFPGDPPVWADRNAGRFDSALGSPAGGEPVTAAAAGLPTLAEPGTPLYSWQTGEFAAIIQDGDL